MNDDSIKWIREHLNEQMTKCKAEISSFSEDIKNNHGYMRDVMILASLVQKSEAKLDAYKECMSLIDVCEKIEKERGATNE